MVHSGCVHNVTQKRGVRCKFEHTNQWVLNKREKKTKVSEEILTFFGLVPICSPNNHHCPNFVLFLALQVQHVFRTNHSRPRQTHPPGGERDVLPTKPCPAAFSVLQRKQ